MSLLPLLFSAWWADLERPHRIWDQHFGVGLTPEQLYFPSPINRMYSPLSQKAALDLYYRPLAEIARRAEGGTSTITADKNTFKVILDVQQFTPDEITMKLVGRLVVVEAKHEEKRDEHGFISRQFVRKYLLPEQVDETQLSSSISSDGILTITAPVKETQEKPNERTIKIEVTGKPAIRSDTSTTGTAEGTTTPKMENEKPIIAENTNQNQEEITENQPEEKPEK